MTWGSSWNADNSNQPASQPAVQPVTVDIPPHIRQRLEDAKMTLDKDGLLQLWQYDEMQLKHFKDTEMELRKICANWLVPVPEKKGINNVDLGNGYIAKVGIKINYKFDATNEQIEDVQDRIEKVGNEGAFLADRLVRWKADLSVTEYENLLKDAAENPNNPTLQSIKTLMQSIVVTDNGAPTLEIKAPKGKK